MSSGTALMHARYSRGRLGMIESAASLIGVDEGGWWYGAPGERAHMVGQDVVVEWQNRHGRWVEVARFPPDG